MSDDAATALTFCSHERAPVAIALAIAASFNAGTGERAEGYDDVAESAPAVLAILSAGVPRLIAAPLPIVVDLRELQRVLACSFEGLATT